MRTVNSSVALSLSSSSTVERCVCVCVCVAHMSSYWLGYHSSYTDHDIDMQIRYGPHETMHKQVQPLFASTTKPPKLETRVVN